MSHKTSLLIAAAAIAATPALAAPLQLDLTNGSSRDLEALYAAPAGSDAWGDDVLGGAFLPSGNTASLTLAADDSICEYDLRFEFAGGDPVEAAGVDVCSAGAYTVND